MNNQSKKGKPIYSILPGEYKPEKVFNLNGTEIKKPKKETTPKK